MGSMSDQMKTVVAGIQEKSNAYNSSSEKDAETKPLILSARPTPVCAKCDDLGFVSIGLVQTRSNHYENKIVRCECKKEEDRQKRLAFLLRMDGLTEQERHKSFANIKDMYDDGSLHIIRQAVQERRGLITLIGNYGVGKTTLLMCAVNEGRQAGHLALYTTLTDLLSYLRSTFSPDSDMSFDKYWQALIDCDILALDELDEPKTSDWVLEIFMRLMDERWRRMDERLTLCATNRRIQALHGKIQSRLNDGRARILAVGGQDMRPLNNWQSN